DGAVLGGNGVRRLGRGALRTQSRQGVARTGAWHRGTGSDVVSRRHQVMAEAKAETEKADAPAGNGRRWRIGIVVVVVLLVIGGIFWLRSRGRESTDDAQVDGRITQISARVGGPVITVAVDN